MGIAFLDRWRARHGALPSARVAAEDPQGVAELLAECELLREQARDARVELDDSPASLDALDQLVPAWRDDPEVSDWLGNDAGLYLGTVVVRHVPGARWHLWDDGHPVVLLASDRELDVVALGHSWANEGWPQLAVAYAEADED